MGLAVVAVSTLALRSAAADTKSWTAVKSKLPASTSIVVGVDVVALRAASSFPTLVSSVLDEDRDVKQVFELVKSACAIDALTAISDVTIAVDGETEQGVIAIGLDGLDEPKLVACTNKLLQQQAPNAKLVAKPGKVTEYAVEREKFYVAWLAKDVLVIGTKPDKRVNLDAMLSGKPPRAELATRIGKTSTSALVWGAFAIKKDGITGGQGTLTLSKGMLAFAAKISTASAAVNAKLLEEGKGELAQTTKRAKDVPAVAKVLQSIKLVGAGTEIAFELAVAEAELPSVMKALDKLF